MSKLKMIVICILLAIPLAFAVPSTAHAATEMSINNWGSATDKVVYQDSGAGRYWWRTSGKARTSSNYWGATGSYVTAAPLAAVPTATKWGTYADYTLANGLNIGTDAYKSERFVVGERAYVVYSISKSKVDTWAIENGRFSTGNTTTLYFHNQIQITLNGKLHNTYSSLVAPFSDLRNLGYNGYADMAQHFNNAVSIGISRSYEIIEKNVAFTSLNGTSVAEGAAFTYSKEKKSGDYVSVDMKNKFHSSITSKTVTIATKNYENGYTYYPVGLVVSGKGVNAKVFKIDASTLTKGAVTDDSVLKGASDSLNKAGKKVTLDQIKTLLGSQKITLSASEKTTITVLYAPKRQTTKLVVKSYYYPDSISGDGKAITMNNVYDSDTYKDVKETYNKKYNYDDVTGEVGQALVGKDIPTSVIVNGTKYYVYKATVTGCGANGKIPVNTRWNAKSRKYGEYGNSTTWKANTTAAKAMQVRFSSEDVYNANRKVVMKVYYSVAPPVVYMSLYRDDAGNYKLLGMSKDTTDVGEYRYVHPKTSLSKTFVATKTLADKTKIYLTDVSLLQLKDNQATGIKGYSGAKTNCWLSGSKYQKPTQGADDGEQLYTLAQGADAKPYTVNTTMNKKALVVYAIYEEQHQRPEYKQISLMQNADGSYSTFEYYDSGYRLNFADGKKYTHVIGFEPAKTDAETGNVYELQSVWSKAQVHTDTLKYRTAGTRIAAGTFTAKNYTQTPAATMSNHTYTLALPPESGKDYAMTTVYGIYKEVSTTITKTDGGPKSTIEEFDTTAGSVSGSDVTAPQSFTGDLIAYGTMSCDVSKSTVDFDAAIGIPTSEYVKGSIRTPEYLVKGQWAKHSRTWTYKVPIYQAVVTGTVSTDSHGNQQVGYTGQLVTNVVSGSVATSVSRTASAYALAQGLVYLPKEAAIHNEALADGMVYYSGLSKTNPSNANTLYFTQTSNAVLYEPVLADGVTKLVYDTVYTTTAQEQTAAVQKWTAAAFQSAAEGVVGRAYGQNAVTLFNNGNFYTYLLDGSQYSEDNAEQYRPGSVPEASLTVLYEGAGTTSKAGLIAKTAANGESASTGIVHYYLSEYSANSAGVAQDLLVGASVNSVVVHTPVVATQTVTVLDNFSQSVWSEAETNLVLDTQFKIEASAKGTYTGYTNYDKISNFTKYLATNEDGEHYLQVRFSFPVVMTKAFNATTREDVTGDRYYDKLTWISLPVNEETGIASAYFYVPTWAEESVSADVRTRAIAENAIVDDDTERVARKAAQQEAMNSDVDKYVAYKSSVASVNGRIYGLKIIDVADYPEWESYFRDTKGRLTGNSYASGIFNQFGISSGQEAKYTFPMVAGSHPSVANLGILSPGYVTRFSLETVGDLSDSDDYVKITPTFWYVPKDDEDAVPVRVDVYYDETIRGKKQTYVKVGSALDRQNVHSLGIGDDKFSLPTSLLRSTQSLLGLDTQSYVDKKTGVWTYGNVMIPSTMSTCTGDTHVTYLRDENGWMDETVCYGEKADLIVAGTLNTSEGDIYRSTQQWYCTYYLPSVLHVMEYSEDNPEDGSVVSDALWLDDGYLLVNFDVKTVNGGAIDLAYDNTAAVVKRAEQAALAGGSEASIDASQVCDMWGVEGYLTTKYDSSGRKFSFREGDFIVYDLSATGGSARDDYGSAGTH